MKLHFGLRTIPHDTHPQHTSLWFNECLSHLCDCKCSNVMCMLNYLMIKPKNIFECFICFCKWFYTFVLLVFVQNALLCFSSKNMFRGCFSSMLFGRNWISLYLVWISLYGPIEISWIPRTSLIKLQKHTLLGSISSYTYVVCQRFSSGRPSGLIRHYSSPAWHLYILRHFFPSDERTCGSQTSSMWPQHSLIRKASPCSSITLSLW